MSALDTAMSVIKKFEGCRLNAYPDPGTGGEPWTIGWGYTIYANGQKVKKGDVITKEDAESLLRFYVNQFLNSVDSVVKSEISENQLAALTSFAYNCGIAAFSRSTLLKKVNANPKDLTIRDEFMKWKKAGGKVLPGLVKRRSQEADLYFKP
jgi:lysozyme